MADDDDLKERTKAIEEATVNMTMKNDEHRAAIDALENRMEEMMQRPDLQKGQPEVLQCC